MYALAILLGAFLLFAVQPLIGRFILPWFGGGPAVWTTCLLFFQTSLLAGYAYAHWLSQRCRPRVQALIHTLLLIAAVCLLPITPSAQWKPADPFFPTLRILLLLLITVGLPFIVLSATAPLVQAWFARARPGRSPYRLYALSNAGSMLALLSYPFLIEPAFSRRQQSAGWSIGFTISVVICGYCAWRSSSAKPMPADSGQAAAPQLRHLPHWAPILWLLLPAAASVVLMGTTNTLTLDVAPVPFLWVLPLAVYLLSFIVAFDHPRWYRRDIFAVAMIPAAGLWIWLLRRQPGSLTVGILVALYCAILFICCMACHGELARLRPDAGRLTAYYLSIAAGGAIGGAFVALVAPRIFTDFAELRWGIFATAMLLLVALGTDRASRLYRLRPTWAWFLIAIGMTILGGVAIAGVTVSSGAVNLVRLRNFYGTLSVVQYDMDGDRYRVLEHGQIIHGIQFTDPARRRLPISYYGPHGGPALLMEAVRLIHPKLRVGALGLGAGSLAGFGRDGDFFRFYEIDPQVESLARSYFTYLSNCPAKCSVILGDGRLSLEREMSQQFDVLILDAFSGDSIPVHLLTAEAFDHYLRHLKPDGVILINLTNKYLDLLPLAARLAEHFRLRGVYATHVPGKNCPIGEFRSTWAILARDPQLLDAPSLRALPVLQVQPDVALWTDDRVDLIHRFRRANQSLEIRIRQK